MVVVSTAEDGGASAVSNVRVAIPAMEAYYADHGTYVGATANALRAIDGGIDPTVSTHNLSGSSYCIESVVNGTPAQDTGPNGTASLGSCP